ncbi:deoxyribodipyrimidine photo-lyase [Rubinisphaera sp.]|uniref:cryptochrome/photolyase family protein n=1 Tax=Rubinisphaera sp. TaxID=2024857 RepID=UPI0025F96774|nr:deoxyribodipyrimidine photo-lyase [Rubinisphaera sp.]
MSVSKNESPVIVWFRQDLRLEDHPALLEASKLGRPLILLFILPDRDTDWFPGGASCWWLHRSLQVLGDHLKSEFDQKLILRQGEALSVLQDVIQQTQATAVFWNRLYEPHEQEADEQIITELSDDGVVCELFPASLLVDPSDVYTQSENPYQVFTPFWKACRKRLEFAKPLPKPQKLAAPDRFPESFDLKDLNLDPTIDWAGGLEEMWNPGTKGAERNLKKFLKESIEDYKEERNIPNHYGTSRLSPHLHFGEITPRQIYWETQEVIEKFKDQHKQDAIDNAETYLSEIGWREFAYYVLYHFPHTVSEPLQEKFQEFKWKTSQKWLKAWQKGQTGYPIVDAGMRELWHTGWMHNRVRMIVASFLTKDLQIHWKEGADWFMDTLVDADLANNTLGWQWTSGCGADAAPYFRVFNPTTQSEKFDKQGEYLRKWCPELADLPNKWIHKPFEAPEDILKKAAVELGKDYPEPIVDHGEQREVALEKWEKIK